MKKEEIPSQGGSYTRDKKTGALKPAAPAGPVEKPDQQPKPAAPDEQE